MASRSLRLAFGTFHAVLGGVVLIQSIMTLLHGLHPSDGGNAHVHAVLVAGVEALGALLFLAGRTVVVGGALMLLTFAVALAVHGLATGLTLLVYAAGTAFVMTHGSLWLGAGRPSDR
jgi:hypothetical protein